ncbi:hypothetical protein COCSUDRAFT_34102 [Coccomyxa subellipsoidea C-169]|uniref:Uncharacterized protein n=1 Tax=Coccomyxa subellipsoidea (strain C-169) TaxID=574566 RepID=I0YPK6_COCSC|nr:hypothetical protein COCSUDRAFT_34102 [Coccomyxa subellipsoidea C-169]EIE20325.1 hypothetical protein COCSUDRAFT_34102 [Coccomyxa subellipsoidea C-169]|eukprot:XP_005644869.1 hypothetical protein COCSUDRAFT_34102 [Coccomyxa subellipsoidea C-169]
MPDIDVDRVMLPRQSCKTNTGLQLISITIKNKRITNLCYMISQSGTSPPHASRTSFLPALQ